MMLSVIILANALASTPKPNAKIATGGMVSPMPTQTSHMMANSFAKGSPLPMNRLANNVSYTPIKTYYAGTTEMVHPCVIYSAAGWNGYHYIMVFTPLYLGDPHSENPSLRVSNDGYSWVKLPGEPDPIISEPAVGFYSDPSIQLIGNKLYLFYRYGNDPVSPTTVYIEYTTTIDGVHWTPPVRTDLTWVLSPTILYTGAGWQAWAFDENSSSHSMKYYTSTDGIHFKYVNTSYLPMPASSTPWHGEVKYYGGVYYLLCTVNPGDYAYSLYFYWSIDGINWHSQSNNPVMERSKSGWDNIGLYKSTFLLTNNTWRVWYSASGSGNHWHTGYTQTSLTSM